MNQNIPITVAGAVRGFHAKPLARAHASRLTCSTCSFSANEKAPLTPRILRERVRSFGIVNNAINNVDAASSTFPLAATDVISNSPGYNRNDDIQETQPVRWFQHLLPLLLVQGFQPD